MRNYSYDEYTYDNVGNRLTQKTVEGDNTVVISFTYDAENRLTQSITGNATTYYGYDNNGNQISQWTRFSSGTATNGGVSIAVQSEETDDLLTLYEYDIFDRLVKIEQGADVIENIYTADGKKLSKTINGKITYYVYDGNVVIEEQRSNNSESARNVYGRNLITREASSDKYVYGYNGHGDVVYLTDTNGIVEITYDYDEFGNIISEEVVETSVSTLAPTMIDKVESAEENVEIIKTVINNPYRYAGYEYIKEVGIYDLNARYYNPEIARFLSADPYYNLGNRVIGVYEINVPTAASIIQANNLYVYCGNSPTIYIDPNGESIIVSIAVGALLVGGLLGLTSCNSTSVDDFAKKARHDGNVVYTPNEFGYYGEKGSSSSSAVRHISGGNNAAMSFFNNVSGGYYSEIEDGVYRYAAPDGTIYTYRSTSKDGTPVIDINGKNGTQKSQKIHFVD